MNNNTQSHEICPVCNQRIIESPNGVCLVCYNKAKRDYIHDYQWHKNWYFKMHEITETSEIQEYNIHSWMTHEQNNWNEVIQNGLSAIQVFIDILDDMEDDKNHTWHKRRIRFMQDMVERLDSGCFAPATKQQIAEYAQYAVDFWDGKISNKEAKEKTIKMEELLQKRIEDIKWNAKDFLLWMMHREDFFDWMWDQWFECLHDCISAPCNDKLWIELFHKHFPKEIEAWADK